MVFRIDDNYTKIGITHKKINERYSFQLLDKCKSFEIFQGFTISECFKLEQILKRIFSKNSISKSESLNLIRKFGWTEIFKDNYDDIIQLTNHYIKDIENVNSEFNILKESICNKK